jgi:hypothetical protein
MKKVTKKSSMKIKILKTSLKFYSAAGADRPSSSTRVLLPLHFLVVFLRFLFKGEAWFVDQIMLLRLFQFFIILF